MAYRTPGVFVEEISVLPPSVAQVETAIPAFIGYTVNTTYKGETLVNKPRRVTSFPQFEEIFGKVTTAFTATAKVANGVHVLDVLTNPGLTVRMNYALRMYFDNGGGPCYICGTGAFNANSAATLTALQAGLAEVAKVDEPTILLFPDAPVMGEDNFYQIYRDALAQCDSLGDRVALVDVFNTGAQPFSAVESNFRTKIGNKFLKYGAAYYPWLTTNLNFAFDETAIAVTGGSLPANTRLRKDATEAESVFHSYNNLYHQIIDAITKEFVALPPSSAVAGVYAQVDASRGVWKAPANVSLNTVKKLNVDIDDADQESMNVDTTGKSVNAIRSFTGKGILVWGARTLAGNDNEWRYVPVRRFFNMVEESVKKATEQFVFEPNDENTWTKVRAMIENFLFLQWRAGALAGATTDEAFFVRVGLGKTMTPLDILEGRMIVEIGMAVVRPAEFIILRFSHKMQTS